MPLDLSVHRHILAAARDQLLAGLEVIALDRGLGGTLELFGPVAQAVAEPRRFGLELRQAELFPDHARTLHVFALRQRDRREVFLHLGVDQHPGIFALVALAARAVALVPGRPDLHVQRWVWAIRHRPQKRVRIVGIGIFVYPRPA